MGKIFANDKADWSEVAQSCQTLHDLMDYSLSGSSVHGIFQARVLEWIAISFYLKYISSSYNSIFKQKKQEIGSTKMAEK